MTSFPSPICSCKIVQLACDKSCNQLVAIEDCLTNRLSSFRKPNEGNSSYEWVKQEFVCKARLKLRFTRKQSEQKDLRKKLTLCCWLPSFAFSSHRESRRWIAPTRASPARTLFFALLARGFEVRGPGREKVKRKSY